MLKKSNNRKYPLYLGGATLLGGLVYLFYKNFSKESSRDYKIEKEKVKKILIDFKKEYYFIFKQLI